MGNELNWLLAFLVGCAAGVGGAIATHTCPVATVAIETPSEPSSEKGGEAESGWTVQQAEKYGLERRIEELQKQLAEREKICSAADLLASAKREKEKTEAELGRRLAEQAASTQANKLKLVEDIRAGRLTLEELEPLLLNKPARDALALLGNPDRTKLPKNTDEAGAEQWSFSNRVKVLASNHKRSLLVLIQRGVVQRISAYD